MCGKMKIILQRRRKDVDIKERREEREEKEEENKARNRRKRLKVNDKEKK